jgi:hypothetical protein
MNDPTADPCTCPWERRFTVGGAEHPQGVRVDAEEAEQLIDEARTEGAEAERNRIVELVKNRRVNPVTTEARGWNLALDAVLRAIKGSDDA